MAIGPNDWTTMYWYMGVNPNYIGDAVEDNYKKYSQSKKAKKAAPAKKKKALKAKPAKKAKPVKKAKKKAAAPKPAAKPVPSPAPVVPAPAGPGSVTPSFGGLFGGKTEGQ